MHDEVHDFFFLSQATVQHFNIYSSKWAPQTCSLKTIHGYVPGWDKKLEKSPDGFSNIYMFLTSALYYTTI